MRSGLDRELKTELPKKSNARELGDLRENAEPRPPERRRIVESHQHAAKRVSGSR
jgi:hypothetical protein